jgi:copper(I)-binding protein
MTLLAGVSLFVAASIVSVPTPPGVASTDVTAHHGSIYQTGNDGQTTQGFLEIDNAGPADVLTRTTCAIADITNLVDASGHRISRLPIPARGNVVLAPGRAHLILQNLHFSVAYGGIIPCSLTFATAGTVSVFLYATPVP